MQAKDLPSLHRKGEIGKIVPSVQLMIRDSDQALGFHFGSFFTGLVLTTAFWSSIRVHGAILQRYVTLARSHGKGGTRRVG